MRVIFLDVDGVLNSKSYIHHWKLDHKHNKNIDLDSLDGKLCDNMIKRLAKLQKKFDNTVIVLTSGWKEEADRLEHLEKRLAEFGLKIYDKTLAVNEYGELCDNRPEEIKEWLRMHKDYNIRYWVSLDDDFDYDDYDNTRKGYSYHLCKTEYGELEDKVYETGFTSLKYHEALEILGGILN